LHTESRARRAAGADRGARFDHAGRGVVGRIPPRRPDPESADPYRLVKVAPPVLPSRLDRIAARTAEGMPQPLLPQGVGVGGQLDPVGAVELLEARWKQLEQDRPRCLRAPVRQGDRDSSQRKALFSRWKKPSSGRYASSPIASATSSSSLRASGVRRRGTATLTSTRWSPLP